jgi:hypothetical protein
VLGHRNLLLMVDIVNALQDSSTRHAERGELQRDWVVSSAECSHRAEEALAKAAEVLADHAPRERPDDELARAWAAVGQGWASLSHAEAVRSMAAAAFAADQVGVTTYPTT